jgi:hypothetical protein
MKSNLKKIGTLALITIALASCTPNGTPTPTPTPTPLACNTVGTDFQLLYSATLASNIAYDNYTTMDLVTHEYTFKANANKTICTIGYQGNAALFAASVPYTIEIYNTTTSMLVYTGNHIFNSVSTDFQTITPTPIIAGNIYTIRRIASNYLGNIGNTIGRICRKNSGPNQFPASNGAITIVSSNFYGTGGPVPNFGIPYIDIVFQ